MIYNGYRILHLAVLVLSARLDQGNLLGTEVEEAVDPLVEVDLAGDDRGSVLAVLLALDTQPLLPVVAIFDGDVALEDLQQLGAQGREVEIPPGAELLIEPLARPAQVAQDAVARPPVQRVASLRLCGDVHRQIADGLPIRFGGVGDGQTSDKLGEEPIFPQPTTKLIMQAEFRDENPRYARLEIAC